MIWVMGSISNQVLFGPDVWGAWNGSGIGQVSFKFSEETLCNHHLYGFLGFETTACECFDAHS